jgi:hypothetical protein
MAADDPRRTYGLPTELRREAGSAGVRRLALPTAFEGRIRGQVESCRRARWAYSASFH